MARNVEKSRSLFSQWNSLVSESEKGKLQRRPGHTGDCHVLAEAEKWRKEVIREALQKVASIANAELGEQRIRDMNDEINKLIKLKWHWDRRIVDLGGQNYAKTKQQLDVEGKELPSSKGYKYYGAAKELPGVREKFLAWEKEVEQLKKKEKKKTRKEFLKGVGEDYYKTEENEILEAKELEKEKELVRSAEQEHESATAKRRRMSGKAKSTGNSDDEEEELHAFLRGDKRSAQASSSTSSSGAPSTGQGAVAVTDLLVDAKKSALLNKYA